MNYIAKYKEAYNYGYVDGYSDGIIEVKDMLQDYINDLLCVRSIVKTGTNPEYNGQFGAAVADGQKTLLDNIISRLEEIAVKEVKEG